MEKWTYYLAVPMAVLSAIGQINIFNSLAIQGVGRPVIQFAFTNELWLPSLTVLLVMTAGTMFAIWLGNLITEQGILIRFATSDVRETGRAAQGVRLIDLAEGDRVVAVAKLAERDEENGADAAAAGENG